MRTKALVLAAHPPIEGPWVPLRVGEEWTTAAECRPNGAHIDASVTIEVMDQAGDVHPLLLGESIQGVAVRAVVKEIEGVEIVSIFLEDGL